MNTKIQDLYRLYKLWLTLGCIISYALVTLTRTSLEFSNSPGASPSLAYAMYKTKPLALVVQKLDSAIHRINHYPADK